MNKAETKIFWIFGTDQIESNRICTGPIFFPTLAFRVCVEFKFYLCYSLKWKRSLGRIGKAFVHSIWSHLSRFLYTFTFIHRLEFSSWHKLWLHFVLLLFSLLLVACVCHLLSLCTEHLLYCFYDWEEDAMWLSEELIMCFRHIGFYLKMVVWTDKSKRLLFGIYPTSILLIVMLPISGAKVGQLPFVVHLRLHSGWSSWQMRHKSILYRTDIYKHQYSLFSIVRYNERFDSL